MHPAKATAERAAFVDLQVCPVPDADILGNRIAVVAHNLERVRVLGNETETTRVCEIGKNIGRLSKFPHKAPRLFHACRAAAHWL